MLHTTKLEIFKALFFLGSPAVAIAKKNARAFALASQICSLCLFFNDPKVLAALSCSYANYINPSRQLLNVGATQHNTGLARHNKNFLLVQGTTAQIAHANLGLLAYATQVNAQIPIKWVWIDVRFPLACLVYAARYIQLNWVARGVGAAVVGNG
jgi:hypothetical protein